MCITWSCLDTRTGSETASFSRSESPILGVCAQLDTQLYAGVTPLTGFSFLFLPCLFFFSFLFILLNLFAGVEFWPGEAQHLSVGEGVGGSEWIFQVAASLCTQHETPALGRDSCGYSPLGASVHT